MPPRYIKRITALIEQGLSEKGLKLVKNSNLTQNSGKSAIYCLSEFVAEQLHDELWVMEILDQTIEIEKDTNTPVLSEVLSSLELLQYFQPTT